MSCSTITSKVDIEDIYSRDKQFDNVNFKLCEGILKSITDILERNRELEYVKLKELLTRELMILSRTKEGILRKTTLSYVYRHMIANNVIKKDNMIWMLLQKCPARNLSGVTVVTLLTSPFPDGQSFSCKHNCYYCPDESRKNGAEDDMPRSYLKREPAVARGFEQGWDCVKQMTNRLDQLLKCSHEIDKLEIIIEGGTYTEYPRGYLERYHRDIFWSANTYFDKLKREKLSLEEEMLINVMGKVRVIGICIETRPDAVDDSWVRFFRDCGVTRIQLGIQHTNNDILKKINRGHKIEDAISTIKKLKDNCFKIDIHLMPDLPYSNPEMDKEMFRYVYNSEDIQPDQIKVYPCEVTPYTVIKKWYDSGKYVPYADENPKALFEVVKYSMTECPKWIRLPRVVRDIPLSYIEGGNKYTNLRQMIDDDLKKLGRSSTDLRTREIGRNLQYKINDSVLKIRSYMASGSKEIFISVESIDEKAIFGFIRLRIPPKNHKPIFNSIKDMGLIRELHVYGNLIPVGYNNDKDSQHKGLGKRLLKKAEEISFYNNLRGCVVISGEGVRDYYKRKGYNNTDTYMIKKFRYRFTDWIVVCILLLCYLTASTGGTSALTSLWYLHSHSIVSI
tara:strand:+ start:2415 stop:4274 length:1860 start_codon:yes stop_codon:yes gene_type:complete